MLRLRSLGDCVLTTPALDILKRHRPDLRIAVVVEDRFRAIYEGNPDISEILPPTLAALRAGVRRSASNLHGGTRSAWMTLLSGARYRAGFAHYRHQFAYNVRIPRAQRFSRWTGRSTPPNISRAPCSTSARPVRDPARETRRRQPTPRRTRGYPCRGGHSRENLAGRRFLAVAARLRDTGLDPVFIGAASDDLSPFRAYRTFPGAPLAK